jgi:hypothetical protein
MIHSIEAHHWLGRLANLPSEKIFQTCAKLASRIKKRYQNDQPNAVYISWLLKNNCEDDTLKKSWPSIKFLSHLALHWYL